MSAPAYTLTEDRPGWHCCRRDGVPIYEGSDGPEVDRVCRERATIEAAHLMLAILVESRAFLKSDLETENFCARRDALITKITGKPI